MNGINPTLVMTRIMDYDEQVTSLKPVIEDKLGRRHPLHGRASTANEQAEVALFLASDAASFLTGQQGRTQDFSKGGALYIVRPPAR